MLKTYGRFVYHKGFKIRWSLDHLRIDYRCPRLDFMADGQGRCAALASAMERDGGPSLRLTPMTGATKTSLDDGAGAS